MPHSYKTRRASGGNSCHFRDVLEIGHLAYARIHEQTQGDACDERLLKGMLCLNRRRKRSEVVLLLSALLGALLSLILIGVGIPAAIFWGERDNPIGQVGAARIGALFGLVGSGFLLFMVSKYTRCYDNVSGVTCLIIGALGMFGAGIPLGKGIEGAIFYHHTIVEMHGATLADVSTHHDVHAFHFNKQPALDLRYHYIQRRADPDKEARSLYRFTTPVVGGSTAVVNDSATYWMVGEFAIVDGRQWTHVAMRPNPEDVDAYVGVVREAEAFRSLTAPPDDVLKKHLLRNKDPEKKRWHYRTMCTNAGIVYGLFWLFAVTGVFVSTKTLGKVLTALSILFPALWVFILFMAAASHTLTQKDMMHLALWPGLLFAVPSISIALLVPEEMDNEDEGDGVSESKYFGALGVAYAIGLVAIPFAIGAEGWHFYHYRVTVVEGVTLSTLDQHYGDAIALKFATAPSMTIREDLKHLETQTKKCYYDGREVCCECDGRCRNCLKHYWQLVAPFEEPDLRRTWLCEKYDLSWRFGRIWEYDGMAPNPTSSDWNDCAYAVQQAFTAQNIALSKDRTFLLRPKSVDHKRAYYSRYFWISLGCIIALYAIYVVLVIPMMWQL